MGKVKKLWEDHKVAIIGGAAAVLGFVGGVALIVLKGKATADNVIESEPESETVINPDYYDTFDEAVDAFRELQKTSQHAALFDWCGEVYGVFDETSVLQKIKGD